MRIELHRFFVVLNAIKVLKRIALIAIRGRNHTGQDIGHIRTHLRFIKMAHFAYPYFVSCVRENPQDDLGDQLYAGRGQNFCVGQLER